MPVPSADPIAAAKADLRSRLRGIRRMIAADAADRAARSERIGAGILGTLETGGRTVRRALLFESLSSEPDSSSWIDLLAARGVDVFLPEVDGEHLRVRPDDLDPLRLDLVVVPGLGFTVDGRRLGQGGGHYDRFLARLAPTCLTIGVCFAEQLLADLPTGPFDRRVDVVVTDADPG